MTDKKFLDELKKAVDEGNFNSEAAKKINKIDDLANKKQKKSSNKDLMDSINEKIDKSGTKTVNDDEISEINSNYQKIMEQRSKEEKIFAIIATLDNIDNEIQNKIKDLHKLIVEQKDKFNENDKGYDKLQNKIEELNNKYKF